MIGSLLYLTASRLGIMFSVCPCARSQSAPKESHIIAITRTFRYLVGIKDISLWHPKDGYFNQNVLWHPKDGYFNQSISLGIQM